jgi:hypothetical protein
MYAQLILPRGCYASCLSARRGAAEETEQAVFKYGARVPQAATKYCAKSHEGAASYARRQVMVTRGVA